MIIAFLYIIFAALDNKIMHIYYGFVE